MSEKDGFKPIRLPDTKVITKNGYYKCQIKSYKLLPGNQRFKVYFEVIIGDHAGFKLDTSFDQKKNLFRITHLCKSAGLKTVLKHPQELVGKKLTLRILPKYIILGGRTTLVHRITRFHPFDWNR